MESNVFLELATGHYKIPVHKWIAQDPKGALIICHGMSEHGRRYAPLGEYLKERGFSVYSYDARGHGVSSLRANSTKGHFADKGGWEYFLEDLSSIYDYVAKDQVPIFLLGHSMGSYVALDFCCRNQQVARPLILTGSAYQSPWELWGGLQVARFERFRLGGHNMSPLIQKLTFGKFNSFFKKAKTDFDWLSSDDKEVQKYVEDPFCGFPCSTQSWFDFITAMKKLFSDSQRVKDSQNVKVKLISGADDPLSSGGSLKSLESFLMKKGYQVDKTIYEGKRHEILNETNRHEVYEEIYDWLCSLT